MKRRILLLNLLVAALGALLFLPGIGSVRLFDWDEINFAESAREMLVTGDWFDVQINFRPFWEKPPLFIWMQALGMKLFGVGEFAARFPNAVGGIVTLLVLFNIGRKEEDTRFGLLWTLMYGISFLPFLYFKSGIIDPWFNLFIFLGIYFFSRYARAPGVRPAALSALFLGLAVMTKGPVGFLIFVLTVAVWLVVRRFRFCFRWKDVAAFFAVFALVGGSWFIVLALSGHADVIRDFILYQIRLFQTKDAGHGGFFAYHFVLLFLGVAPASIFALSTFGRKAGRLRPADFENSSGVDDFLYQEAGCSLPAKTAPELYPWMMISFWVVLILFTIVKTKIVHYSSFCYFPLTYLAAFAAARMMDGQLKFRRIQRILLIILSCAYALVLGTLVYFDRLKDALIPYIQDPFAVSCMEATSEWSESVTLAGLLLVVTTVWFCTSFRRSLSIRSFGILGAGYVVFSMVAILCAVPQIEKYSQASAVDFCIERQGEDCYVQPAYFKSYAQYFYTDRQPQNSCDDFEWLCRGPIDKPCYFIVKDEPGNAERLRDDAPEAQLLYRRTGFLFFVRQNQPESQKLENEQDQQAEVE
ncbi:MAG: glycosyltransferase family 39 protein [Bacteroidales bacterium]|nr:glycosyltransferase family 39 protein [Bacteroidales bacterium]